MDTPLGIIFDCDGTLVDSMGVWRALEESLTNQGGFTLSKADTDIITPLSIPETAAYIHEHFGLGATAAAVETMINEFMLDYYSHRACPRPGALAFVQGLHEQGVPMAVASSTPSELLIEAMKSCGFAPYMKAIVSVEDVGSSKRSPEVYDAARASLGTTRAQTWGFEDATYALVTLSQAGYHTVGIYDDDKAGTWEDLVATADVAIQSFEELTSAGFMAVVASLYNEKLTK